MRDKSIFTTPVKAVNIGATLLGDALRAQQVDVVEIDWRPPKPVQLSPRILKILEELEEQP